MPLFLYTVQAAEARLLRRGVSRSGAQSRIIFFVYTNFVRAVRIGKRLKSILMNFTRGLADLLKKIFLQHYK